MPSRYFFLFHSLIITMSGKMLPWKLILAFLICGCLWGTSQNQSLKKKLWKNFQNAQVKWERSNVCLYIIIIMRYSSEKCRLAPFPQRNTSPFSLPNLLVLRAVEFISGFQVDSLLKLNLCPYTGIVISFAAEWIWNSARQKIRGHYFIQQSSIVRRKYPQEQGATWIIWGVCKART